MQSVFLGSFYENSTSVISIAQIRYVCNAIESLSTSNDRSNLNDMVGQLLSMDNDDFIDTHM